jgi:hypothetical protein
VRVYAAHGLVSKLQITRRDLDVKQVTATGSECCNLGVISKTGPFHFRWNGPVRCSDCFEVATASGFQRLANLVDLADGIADAK